MNTSENRSEILGLLQRRTNLIMIPTVTFLSLVAVAGVTGNCLVLFVYARRFSKTPLRILIIAMAGFDIVTNTVVIPGEIYDSYNFWDFDNPLLCQIRQFINASAIIASNLILLAIAVTRQVDAAQAKAISVVVAVVAMIFSVPYAIIHGRQRKTTHVPGVDGYFCEVDETFTRTLWPTINSGFFICIFLVLSATLVVLYSLIKAAASKHKVVRKVPYPNSPSRNPEGSTHEITVSVLTGVGGNRVAAPLRAVLVARTDYSLNEIPSFAEENASCLTKQTFRFDKEKLNINIYDAPVGLWVERGEPESITELNDVARDQTEGIKEIKGGSSIELHDEARDLRDGVKEVKGDSSIELKDEARDLRDGVKEVKGDSSIELHDEARDLRDGVKEVKGDSSIELHDEAIDLRDGVKEVKGDSSIELHDEARDLRDRVKELKGDSSIELHDEARDLRDGVKELKGDSSTELNDEARDLRDGVNEKRDASSNIKHFPTNFNRLSQNIDSMNRIDIGGYQDTCKHQTETRMINDGAKNSLKIEIPEKPFPFGEEKKLMTEVLRFEESFQTGSLMKHSNSLGDLLKAGTRMRKTRPRRGLGRTSCMLLAINLVFIVTFIPFLALELFKAAKPEVVHAMSEVPLAIFNLFLKSHLLNSAANPIVYSLCDVSFRRECRLFFQRR